MRPPVWIAVACSDIPQLTSGGAHSILMSKRIRIRNGLGYYTEKIPDNQEIGRLAPFPLSEMENALNNMRVALCFFALLSLCISCSSAQSGQIAETSLLASPINPGSSTSPVSVVPSAKPVGVSTVASTPTRVAPFTTATREPIVPPTPSDPQLGIWMSKSTYQSDSPLFFIAEFQTVKWDLVSGQSIFPALVHRTIAGCKIEPEFGRDLPPDYSVDRTYKQLGSFLYELHAVKYQGRLVFINYCTHDVATELSTCFSVTFHDQEQVRIQEAEDVLETLDLFEPKPSASP